MRAVSRSYGETRALRGCFLSVRRGEVHAVIGENGSGKSTLIKILSGVIFPDSGEIYIDDQPFRRIGTPRVAHTLGIASVFQEILTVDSLSVLDNVWLGLDGDFRTRLNHQDKRSGAAELLTRLVEAVPDLDARMEDADLSTKQVCVIARALLRRPRVLILDESTSTLDVSTRGRLFDILRELRAQGTAMLFVSHRMDEIFEIADRATVLRNGTSVATLDRHEFDRSTILELMSGQQAGGKINAGMSRASGETLLELDDVIARPEAPPLNMTLRCGEIIGVGGLEGHGQERFVRILAGIERPTRGAVVRHKNGRRIPVDSRRKAAEVGIAYVPRDRKAHGVFEPLSVLDNFSLPSLGRDASRFGVISERRRKARLREWAGHLNMKFANPRHSVTSLSGGTQQKLVIARWLALNPQLLVLDDPTRGIDIATKSDIYDLLRDLASRGVTVVMLSTEIEELLTLMDRVFVFREGHVVAEIPRENLTRHRLVAAFFGHKDEGRDG